MEIPEWILPSIVTLFTGGGLWKIVDMIRDSRLRKLEGERESRSEKAQRLQQHEETVWTHMEAAMNRLDADVQRLTANDEKSRERITKLEEANRDLATENRTFRDVIVGVLERLRRQPPDEPASILEYIFKHLPNFGKDPTP